MGVLKSFVGVSNFSFIILQMFLFQGSFGM